jgi:serine phosphatase RsbU (regulator of sigma subunit)
MRNENYELTQIKPDKMPIGIYIKNNPFTYNEVQLIKDDSLYIFSDGYIDQFGGDKGSKFMTKRFKQLLLSVQAKPMEEQKEILDKNIEEWKNGTEQVDDILVIGFKV